MTIQSRREFDARLKWAEQEIRQRLAQAPTFQPYQAIARQLAAIEAWTMSGRTPTPDERRQINIGLIAVRELEPLEQPGLAELIDALHDINYAFETWPRAMNA